MKEELVCKIGRPLRKLILRRINAGNVEWHAGWSVLTDCNYSRHHGRNQLEKGVLESLVKCFCSSQAMKAGSRIRKWGGEDETRDGSGVIAGPQRLT
ncbi:hypothetical protein ZIOFF_075635 [Zingiber officinale]|uniref:Uncharacterized protein n=1 Tax=Zingiber officinale TaxID=94328 RepID=A0A8J5BTI7_ZINOF|nr:hypothetical protein ZIOFF_075635 [Zingiber officinale]